MGGRCTFLYQLLHIGIKKGAIVTMLPQKFRGSPIFISETSEIAKQKIVVLATPQSAGMPPVLGRLTWTHHIEILRGAVSQEEMMFYLLLAMKERCTVQELRRQIQSALFERQMLSQQTLLLPEHPQKEALVQIFRDRYLLEFLDLSDTFSEFELKKALIAKMKQFLLELGRDFIFIDEELHLLVGTSDYYVDLVFYHRELQCLVAFDLKIDAFKPEYLGKMNFYLEVLDREVRKPHENPSMGVVLCKSKEDEVVEITMSRQVSPALVAVYETKFLDKELLRNRLQQWSQDWEKNQSQ
jgi:predicted nuclease of restriction endonuclease-like (RecB) superfamily